MWSVWVESIPEARPEKIISWGFMNFGLFTIFLLHMYWFGMIIKIGTYYRRTGQARDLQSNLSSMDFGDKKRIAVLRRGGAMKRLRKSQDGPAAAPAGEVKEEEEDDEDDEIEEVSMQVVLADQDWWTRWTPDLTEVECKEEKVKVKRKRAKAKAAPRGKLRKPKLPQFAFEKFREEEPSLPELVTRWKAMSDEERGRFIQLAEEDRRRFEREYEEWREERAQLGKPEPALQALLEKRRSTLERKLNRSEEPPKKLVSKKRAPKNFPKRPVNSAYSLFCSEQPKMSALPEEEAPEPVPSEEGVAEDAQKAKQRRSAGRLVALQKAWSALSDEEWRWRNQQVFDIMEASPVKVAIIGAGLGGLTLAKTLVEGSGVEVCLYEAWDQWKVRGGALGLAAGERILKSFGLGEKLEAVANHGQDLQVHFGANGKRLGSLDFTGCMAMRTDLQKLLVDSLPPQIIKLGHKVTDIVEGDEEVLLTFENGATASAHLVVAADGIHSFVRQRVFGKDSPIFTGFRMLYSVSTKPYRPNPSINNIHWMEVDGVGYGILELTAGQDSSRHDICALILQSKEEVTDRWDSTMVRERFEQVAQQLGDLAVLKTAVENSEVCFDWGIYRSPERETWISPKGRTVLLGDAAHATAPFMGQGANMAMHDAYCLGQILLNPKISLSDGLQLYESSRKAHCESEKRGYAVRAAEDQERFRRELEAWRKDPANEELASKFGRKASAKQQKLPRPRVKRSELVVRPARDEEIFFDILTGTQAFAAKERAAHARETAEKRHVDETGEDALPDSGPAFAMENAEQDDAVDDLLGDLLAVEETFEERPPMMRRETRANLLQHASTCPGLEELMIPSYWPEYVIDMFQNARLSEMPFVSFTERVADGVGEWQWRFGLDPRAFADELMNGAKTAGEQTQHQVGMKAAMRAQLMLSEGYQGASSFGSATALVAALDPSGEAKLGVANLGDSGLRTAPVGYDLPEHSDSYTFEVQEGDVVCELAQISLEATVGSQEKAGPWHIDPSRLAKAYAEAARDTSARTPFGNLARQAGLQHMGGKMDDISVVVGVVVKASAFGSSVPQAAGLGPQLCLDESGNIVLNQSSLSQNVNAQGPFEEASATVQEAVSQYAGAFKKTPSCKWTSSETELFYEALSLYGTDLFLVQTFFRNKSAGQIKTKYQKEMKRNPHLVEEALTVNAKRLTKEMSMFSYFS
eukprot:g10387.t2